MCSSKKINVHLYSHALMQNWLKVHINKNNDNNKIIIKRKKENAENLQMKVSPECVHYFL